MKLIPKNGEGKNVNQPLPILIIQHFFDVKTAQLAVIFDVKNSPDMAFYPHFTANNPEEILALQQGFLWENHCYELFLAFSNEENSPYVEVNFSPKGEFNLYHFDGYRTPVQMPPRRLQMMEHERQQLLNCYSASQDGYAVFWQNSTLYQQAMQAVIEEKIPLPQGNHRLVMLADVKLLAELLKVDKSDEIWLNPCTVFKGEQEMTYFAHQHASPPDFHDKKYWIKVD